MVILLFEEVTNFELMLKSKVLHLSVLAEADIEVLARAIVHRLVKREEFVRLHRLTKLVLVLTNALLDLD